MANQWDAEEIIEPPLALNLIKEQFPELAVETIRLLGVGWDNTAFIVDEELIFRFPRRKFSLPLLETEWCALPKLASSLPLPVPIAKWKGIPSAQFPWPFIGYRMLSGFTACYANLSENERAKLAEPIASFLSVLHGTPLKEVLHCQIPLDKHNRVDGNQLTAKIRKNIEELSFLGLLEHKDHLEAAIEKLQNFRRPEGLSVVHGDFYVRHLLLDEKHNLSGVIDWGNLHLGDPANDLSIAHSFLPKSAHSLFLKVYGNVSEETWLLSKLRAFHVGTLLLLYGYHSGDPDLMREGFRALKIMSQD